MKKTTILLFICFVFLWCSAQNRLTPGEIKGKHDTFIINELNVFDSLKYVDIYSKSNKYIGGIPHPKAKNLLPVNQNTDIHVDKKAVKQIIYNVLSRKLIELKQNKESLDVAFDFHPNGELTDVSYTLREDTFITLQDIEEIDRQLRSTIKATFTGRAYLKYEAIYYPVLPQFVF
jgi:hypothetical protein